VKSGVLLVVGHECHPQHCVWRCCDHSLLLVGAGVCQGGLAFYDQYQFACGLAAVIKLKWGKAVNEAVVAEQRVTLDCASFLAVKLIRPHIVISCRAY